MKKIVALFLAFVMIIPANFSMFADEYLPLDYQYMLTEMGSGTMDQQELLELIQSAYVTYQETMQENNSPLTANQQAWLNLINYDNVVRVARTLTEYPFGSRVGASWRYDMFIEYASNLLESWGYEPWIHEFDSTAPNRQSPDGMPNRRYNNGWVEIGGRRYMMYGPAFAAAGSAYAWSVPGGTASATAASAVVIPWQGVAGNLGQEAAFPAGSFTIPANVDVNGRVVFVPLGHGPTMHQPAMIHPTAPRFHEVAAMLQAAGAEAVVFQSRPGRTSFISPFTPYYNVIDDPSTWSWGESSHGRMVNQPTGTPITIPVGLTSHWETHESVESLISDPNRQINVFMENRSDGQNLLAKWESANPSAQNIYLSTHPDSVPSAPGFNDTVLTTAFALELMRILAVYDIQLEHNIVFAGWDMEELGLIGATYYVNDMILGTGGRTAGRATDFWGMYNMDMMAPGQPECVYFQMHVHVPNPSFANQGTAGAPNWQPNPPPAGTRIPAFGPGNFNFYIRRLAMHERARDSEGAMAYALQFPIFEDTLEAVAMLAEDGRHEHRQIVVDPSHSRYGLPFCVDYHFNITWGGGTDHVAFVREWYLRPEGTTDSLRNAAQFDWRRNGPRGVWGAHIPSDWMPGEPGLTANPGNTGHVQVLELLYHRIGDTYQDNFSRDRLEVAGDIVWLALYTSAGAALLPEFGVDIFNNGPVELGATPSRPNASLAQGGTVRMWTQVDGVNTRVPYSSLTVNAVFSDGSCAMDFIRINRIWQDEDNVNFIDAINKDAWNRIYLSVTALGQTAEIVLVSGGEAVIAVPNFLHYSFEDYIDVYVSYGMLPWNASVAALTTSPGPSAIATGFIITEPGWYTIFHRGGANTEHAEFYQVKTYFYVDEDLFVDGEIVFKNVPIENNRRATPVVNRVGAASNFACDQRHPHESLGRATNLVLRLEPIGNRFNTDGVMSIAAAELDPQGNRLPGQRWALGSDVIPWSGPGYFQTPMLRNQIFCDDTGHLVGLVDYTRPLYQWTTQEESEEFMAGLAAGAAHAYTFNAGWATNPFLDTDLPIDFFQLYFMVFTSTDLTGVNCWIEAGERLQANGRPTFFATANAHGNEQSGPESLYAMMHSLAATPWGAQVVQDINLVIYPSINRQGHFQHRRHIEGVGADRTAPGRPEQATQDGNRDFNVQHTQELEIVTSVFNAFRPHLAIDHHERGRIGGYSTTIAGYGNRWTSITGVNNVGGSDTAADDIQWAPSNSPAGHPLQVGLLAEVNERFFNDALDAGIRVWYYDNLVAGPTQGNYWMGLTGAISMISEINGQGNGNEIRRVFSSYASMRSIIEWMVEEADRVHDGINQVRQDWIEAGRVYDPTDLFALEHTNDIRHPQAAASVIPEDSNLPGWTAGTGTVPGLGIRTGTVPLTRDHRFHMAPRYRISLDNQYMYGWTQTIRDHDIIRARSFPTAYVVPLEIEWDTHGIGNAPVRNYADAVARLRQLLTDNAVDYYILDAGMVLPLQQYYAQNPQISPMTRNFRAGLRAQETVVFDVPVLFIPMDQWTRPVIAHIMEPDMGKTVSSTANGGHATSWVNMMIHTAINPVFADGSRTLLHCVDTNNFPIFRLTQDNPRDFMDPTEIPVFGVDIFNNGLGGSPSRPNANLAQSGTIRIWMQLDEVNSLIPYADLDVVAELPNGECAMEFIRINRIWNNLDYLNFIDADKNEPWQIIYLTLTLGSQELEIKLVNSLFSEVVFGLDMFNNGPNGSPSRPNAQLAASGTIRIWTQLDGANATVPYDELVVSAVLYPSNDDAMEFVRVNNMWANPGNVNLIDVDKSDGAWQTIILTATFNGQEIELILDNTLFSVSALGLVAFNNGTDAEVPSMAGTIRIWPQLDGTSAPIPMSALITAVDQDNNDAMQFVTKNRQWAEPSGWQDYNVNFDVQKANANWQTIEFTVVLQGQTVTVTLINNLFAASAEVDTEIEAEVEIEVEAEIEAEIEVETEMEAEIDEEVVL